MKLEINTNGAWRTVLRDLTPALLPKAREAALTLSQIASDVDDTRLTWRTVDAQGNVTAYCQAGRWRLK